MHAHHLKLVELDLVELFGFQAFNAQDAKNLFSLKKRDAEQRTSLLLASRGRGYSSTFEEDRFSGYNDRSGDSSG